MEIVRDIIDYICDFKVSEQTYLDLSYYRYLLALYLVGNNGDVGNYIYVNVREKGENYNVSLNYYLTKPEIINTNKRYYIKLVTLEFNDGAVHSTLLILDLYDKKAYYIDPNGIPLWYDDIVILLYDYLRFHGMNFKISFDLDLCLIGPQYVSGDNYCANWTLLLLYIKTNTDISIKNIIIYLTELPKEQLFILMNNWTCYLSNIIKSNSLHSILRYLYTIQIKMSNPMKSNIMKVAYKLISKHETDLVVKFLEYETRDFYEIYEIDYI